MKNFNLYKNVISKCKLFIGINEKDLFLMLDIIGLQISKYSKNEILIEEDAEVHKFGIVLSGNVAGYRMHENGSSSLVAVHTSSGIFGEILACFSCLQSQTGRSPVCVIAEHNCEILWIDYKSLFCTELYNNKSYSRLIQNLMSIISEQYFTVAKKLQFILISSVRKRITAYLNDIASEKNSQVFSIPLSREQMAEYLNINRSALCRELSRMKNDGLIDYSKNTFRLIEL